MTDFLAVASLFFLVLTAFNNAVRWSRGRDIPPLAQISMAASVAGLAVGLGWI